MKITCSNIGKKFQGQWIFSGFNFEFSSKSKTGIIGFNGSGKSTLISILSGYSTPTKGEIHFIDGQSAIEKEKVFQLCSIGAPYIDVPEELSPREIISTFSSFKPFINNATAIEILEMLRLKKDADKSVKYFSSGMKQRLKIGMAILSDCPLLLLDEPLSNLDKDGIDWFNELMLDYSQSKTIIVASNNIPEELKFCDKILDISDYKIAN